MTLLLINVKIKSEHYKGVYAMKLTLFPSKITKPARNFWNNIHFHPTDAIEDEWGQRILNKFAKDGAAKTVRMYAMIEDIVTENEKCELSV